MRIELADIFRTHTFTCLNVDQARAVAAIRDCRTAELGGHLQQCGQCGHNQPIYNSCRNRHCPKCQGLERAEWAERRRAELLPIPYYHIVFTLPHELGPIALQNPRQIYDMLFSASAQALQDVAANPRHLGAQVGAISLLHTWGQTLVHHPHIHCLVPGGGISLDGTTWVPSKNGFFLPARLVSARFRALFLELLEREHAKGLALRGELETLSNGGGVRRLINKLRRKKWVVFIQAPFSHPDAVLQYQARYANRIALTNDRIVGLDNEKVALSWKDYRENSRKTMSLGIAEFVRRFLQHVLPRGFSRIRYFGTLANRNKQAFLTTASNLLNTPAMATPERGKTWQDRFRKLTGREPDICLRCKLGKLAVIEKLPSIRELRRKRAQLPALLSLTRGPPWPR